MEGSTFILLLLILLISLVRCCFLDFLLPAQLLSALFFAFFPNKKLHLSNMEGIEMSRHNYQMNQKGFGFPNKKEQKVSAMTSLLIHFPNLVHC